MKRLYRGLVEGVALDGSAEVQGQFDAAMSMQTIAEDDDAHSIDVRVVRAYRRGRKRFPDVAFSLVEFAGRVTGILQTHGIPLGRLHLADLWLARAALHGSASALERLVIRAESDVSLHARRAGIHGADSEDAWQSIVVRMVASSTNNPLRAYAGRASLSLYMRTVHLREVFRRRAEPELPSPRSGDPSALHECLERERATLLDDVVRVALAKLKPVERQLLLRHHENGEPLTVVCVELGLLQAEAPHLRKFASRIYQRTLRTLREHVLERARSEHGIESRELADFVPRITAEAVEGVEQGGPFA